MEAEKALRIDTTQGDYPVYVGRDNFYMAKEYIKGKCMIVTDTNVAPLYLDKLKQAIGEENAHSIIVDAGEMSKSRERLFEIIDRLAELEFNREDTIIALGGGVVGDLTGLAGGLYMRGIHLLMIPTTLLSMVDSSCGGKVAINHPMGKNMIGMFYQPKAVIENLTTLSTLSKEQISCGAAEMIKYGCIYDEELFNGLENKDSLQRPQTIYDCIKVKNYYVSKDTFDKGIRMMLNFGHTLGHCIEKASGMLHGQAVAVGMYKEALLGEELGITRRGTAERLKSLLLKYDLPFEVDESISWQRYLLHDKKSGTKGITFALIEDIGKGALHTLSYEEIRKWIL